MKAFKRIMGYFLVDIVLMLAACQPERATDAPPAPAEVAVNKPPAAAATSAGPPGYQIRWRFQTEGALWGGPAVSGGSVYIGSDDGSLYAVDAQDGSLKWVFPTQGIIRSRPSIARGLVFFASDDGNLYAVDVRTGAMVWRTDIGNLLPRQTREGLGTDTAPTGWDDWQSSTMIVDDRVFVGSLDGKLYALETATGRIAWTFQTGQKIRATPAVDAGIVYIGSWDGKSYAVDARTGTQVWAAPLGGQVQTTALVADDVVYTASRKASLVALKALTGDLLWEFDYGRNMWVESSPIVQEGIVYIGSAGNKWVFGLDGLTGGVSTSFFSAHTYFLSTPAILNDTLVIGGATFRNEGQGGLFMFKLEAGGFSDPGRPSGYLPVEESLEAEGNWSGVISSPVVDEGLVYFGGLDGKLYAVGLEH